MKFIKRLVHRFFRRKQRNIDRRPRYIDGKLSILDGCRVESM